jgi:hypothetical protein
MCKFLLESLPYSNSLGENCEVYIGDFSVEVVSAEGAEARLGAEGSEVGLRYGLDNIVHRRQE